MLKLYVFSLLVSSVALVIFSISNYSTIAGKDKMTISKKLSFDSKNDLSSENVRYFENYLLLLVKSGNILSAIELSWEHQKFMSNDFKEIWKKILNQGIDNYVKINVVDYGDFFVRVNRSRI